MFRLACCLIAVQVGPDLDVNGNAYYLHVKAKQLFLFLGPNSNKILP